MVQARARDCWGSQCRMRKNEMPLNRAVAVVVMVIQTLGQSHLDHREVLLG